MKKQIQYLFTVFKVLLKIFLVLAVTGLTIYFVLVKYADYKMNKNDVQKKIRQEENERALSEIKKQKDEEQKLKGDTEKLSAFTECMNKAYEEYKNNWNDACADLKKADECSLTPQKLYEVQEYFKASKKDCEKLKQ
jgi:hypothetical protein